MTRNFQGGWDKNVCLQNKAPSCSVLRLAMPQDDYAPRAANATRQSSFVGISTSSSSTSVANGVGTFSPTCSHHTVLTSSSSSRTLHSSTLTSLANCLTAPGLVPSYGTLMSQTLTFPAESTIVGRRSPHRTAFASTSSRTLRSLAANNGEPVDSIFSHRLHASAISLTRPSQNVLPSFASTSQFATSSFPYHSSSRHSLPTSSLPPSSRASSSRLSSSQILTPTASPVALSSFILQNILSKPSITQDSLTPFMAQSWSPVRPIVSQTSASGQPSRSPSSLHASSSSSSSISMSQKVQHGILNLSISNAATLPSISSLPAELSLFQPRPSPRSTYHASPPPTIHASPPPTYHPVPEPTYHASSEQLLEMFSHRRMLSQVPLQTSSSGHPRRTSSLGFLRSLYESDSDSESSPGIDIH